MINVNFKANYISSVNIKKLTSQKKYNNYCARLVELNSVSDLEALSSLENDWNVDFFKSLYNDARYKLTLIPGKERFYNSKDVTRFYAITTQKQNFKKLEPNKILGLAEVTDCFYDDTYNLDYIVVNPKYEYSKTNKKQRYFIKIGTMLLNKIKSMYSDKTIMLTPRISTELFYEKNGFKCLDSLSGIMFWKNKSSLY